jgi:N-acetylglucosaminyldiphosphoundecaprenol N-acetyl-beta-D-mannosaminyltransferase
MIKKKVIESWISSGTFQDFIDNIFLLTEEKKSSYVCFANVHMLVEAYNDPDFNKILEEADIVTPDGRPLSIYMNIFYKMQQQRVPGMDLMPALLIDAEKKQKSVYFYGSSDEILNLIAKRANSELPNLKIAGYYSPPFRELTEKEKEGIVDKINEANPDLLFVALGCPKQEKWMAEHKGKIHSCMLGVGQAFNVYAGVEKRLPKWMRDLSLEWTYRLFLEPKRLWKRYFVTNSIFVWLFLRIFFSKLVGRRNMANQYK